MEGHISEQQQVEEIKHWLQKNLSSIIVGLVIGLSAVFGWRAWEAHGHNKIQAASAAYTKLVDSYTKGNTGLVMQQGEALISQYGDTSYGSFGALILARAKVDQGDIAAARAHLEWVISNARQPEIKQLAMLRLARVLLTENKTDEAFKQLEAMDAAAFTVQRNELRGDLYRAKGDLAQARTAYQQALDVPDKGADALKESIRLKLDAVGGGPAQERKP